MLTVDIVLAILLILFFISGWRKGLVVAFGQLLGAIVGFIIARSASAWLAGLLAKWIHLNAGWLHIIAFILIFMIVDRLFGLLVGLLNKLFKILTIIPFLSTINSILGAILSFLEGLVLIGSSVYLIRSLHLVPVLVDWTSKSTIAHYAEQIFYQSLKFVLFL